MGTWLLLVHSKINSTFPISCFDWADPWYATKY